MTFMKMGRPFLYDDATGDVVGIKDADGGETMFVLPKFDSTGGINSLSAAGQVIPIAPRFKRLAIIGDSRFAAAYKQYTPTVVSVSGSTISITATGIGSLPVGRSIVVGLASNPPYIRADIASVVDANNITATARYPLTLPQGSIWTTSTRIVVGTSRPNDQSSYPTALLAMLQQPFSEVMNYSYPGGRTGPATGFQARDAVAQGCDVAFLHIGVNDIRQSGSNFSAEKAFELRKHLWRELAGMEIYDFLEVPLGNGTAAIEQQRVVTLNTLIKQYAADYGVHVVDIYTPLLDTATGAALTGALSDGLHPAHYGAKLAVEYVAPVFNLFKKQYNCYADDAGNVCQPLGNPALSGTLGASQLPTNYTQAATGACSISSYELAAKANGVGNEFRATISSSGAGGSHYIKTNGISVTAGKKYRATCLITVTGGTGIDYVEATVRNSSNDALIESMLMSSNTSQVGGANGTYTYLADMEVVIPAGVTGAYIRPRVWFDDVGGATLTYSDFEFRSQD